MKYKIEYYYRSEDADDPCWAKTLLPNEKFLCTCGNSWEAVRTKHMKRLAEKVASPEPPIAEEIDL